MGILPTWIHMWRGLEGHMVHAGGRPTGATWSRLFLESRSMAQLRWRKWVGHTTARSGRMTASLRPDAAASRWPGSKSLWWWLRGLGPALWIWPSCAASCCCWGVGVPTAGCVAGKTWVPCHVCGCSCAVVCCCWGVGGWFPQSWGAPKIPENTNSYRMFMMLFLIIHFVQNCNVYNL